MPQYPMPPWPAPDYENPPPPMRKTRLSSSLRFRELEIVSADANGVITVLRGDDDLAVELADHPQVRTMHEFDSVTNEPHFVVRNRLGRVRFVPSDRLVPVGKVEFYAYTHPYAPAAAIAEAGSVAELRVALEAESVRLAELEADGWELIRYGRSQLLVDTLRPDEHLTARDLP